MTHQPHHPTFGAVVTGDGVRFQVWAPEAGAVQLHLRKGDGRVYVTTMTRVDDGTGSGLWSAQSTTAAAGDRYAFAVEGAEPKPDPASRFQPDGVHGWSQIVDPAVFRWTDAAWTGPDPRRASIYELHVGTFTPEGTFASAMAKMPYLADLGVSTIELMPLADFAGSRNWGYDGVAIYAPARAYGRPDDVRAFVDAAHHAGLAVIVDVVYNHLGPEGAYLGSYSSRYLTSEHQTPWGGAVNLYREGGEVVRRFLEENALHWIHEYHMDGLRLDATHSLFDARERHFVAELTDAVHAAASPAPLVYAEDHRNLAPMVEEATAGGWGLDGVWADDFHHVVRRMLGGDAHGYYVDFEGTARELADTLRRGWLFTGQASKHEGGPRGTDASHVAMRKAVICIQNHDQIGNRALGERLHHEVEPAAWRAAVAVLLTAPMTPLLFMGQEWATSAPFLFFTDFEPELGQKVVEGRRREFRDFPQFATEDAARSIPDPQAASTFEASRLRWDERDTGGHARSLGLHRALLRLRAEHRVLQASDTCECASEALDDGTVMFRREDGTGAPVIVIARLRGSGTVRVPALRVAGGHSLLNTEDAAFACDPRPIAIDAHAGTIAFERPGAVVFQTARTSNAGE